MTKIDFRAEIKKLMKKRKINVPALAREVELNPQTLYNYLAGRTEMTSGNLEKILEFLSGH
jgi:transcriptional regulator with XRE-family HTH domain